MKMKSTIQKLTVGLSFATVANAIEVTWDDDESIKSAASTVAYGLAKYYTGNYTGDTPGNLPDPYYWWEAGAMFGTLVDYWWLTGDDSYNNITTQALLHQVGEDKDYMPGNQTLTEGNDDQGFWAMAAMSAAEHKYPNPPKDQPQWLGLAQSVFNQYVSRWDMEHCGGGMRWQIFTWNTGFDYKNSISNGCFFNIAARLARYTGNDTYADWAEKIWDWHVEVGLITDKYQVFDGVHFEGKCPNGTDETQWSYNTGIFLYGAATMYNITNSDSWKTRVDGMLGDVDRFVNNGILYEQYCEPTKQCTQDPQSFKGYLARWLAATSQVAPHTSQSISTLLLSSGKRAAVHCSGSPAEGFNGHAGTACGFSWLGDTFDGLVGVGPQMSSLQVIMYNLVRSASGPVTAKTGGDSEGNVGGGTKHGGPGTGNPAYYKEITTGDKFGAAVLTIIFTAGAIAGTAFIIF